MSDRKVQKNGIGTKIIVDTTVDITGYSQLRIQYKKPDEAETAGYWPAVPEGPEVDGKISYITQSADDLDVAGAMCIQSDIIIPLWVGRGKSTQLIVMDNC
jgi:hypothetical protein